MLSGYYSLWVSQTVDEHADIFCVLHVHLQFISKLDLPCVPHMNPVLRKKALLLGVMIILLLRQVVCSHMHLALADMRFDYYNCF